MRSNLWTWLSAVVVITILWLLSQDANAQCAMCKAVVESNEQGKGIGINKGIIFLMGVPYLLLTSLAFFFFRKQIGSWWKRSVGSLSN